MKVVKDRKYTDAFRTNAVSQVRPVRGHEVLGLRGA